MAFFILYFAVMDITINTPALFFPAISLVMLAYTNRFLALANRVRSLHDKYVQGEKNQIIHSQITNLRYRIKLIKNMQAFGVISFLCCIFSMYFIYIDRINWANIMFGLGMISFIVSLIMSLLEIQLSTKALEFELSDMDDLKDPSLVNYIKKKFERE
jgi:hypothetical protein